MTNRISAEKAGVGSTGRPPGAVVLCASCALYCTRSVCERLLPVPCNVVILLEKWVTGTLEFYCSPFTLPCTVLSYTNPCRTTRKSSERHFFVELRLSITYIVGNNKSILP